MLRSDILSYDRDSVQRPEYSNMGAIHKVRTLKIITNFFKRTYAFGINEENLLLTVNRGKIFSETKNPHNAGCHIRSCEMFVCLIIWFN